MTPIQAIIDGQNFILDPPQGIFTFVYDLEKFQIPDNILIVGIENPENFRYIRDQGSIFKSEPILFVSRYPQSKDLISWLQKIPNKYLHFGDFDFEGIRIFRDEYYMYLGDRSGFFIPEDIEKLIGKFGSKKIYNRQYKFQTEFNLGKEIEELIDIFHQHKKCLEQEVLIEFKNGSNEKV